MVRIKFTPNQILMGALVGLQRKIENIKRKSKHRHNVPEDFNGWQADIEGALGEMAVAQYLGIYWDEGRTGLPDVGADDVRTTRYHSGHLCLHKSDPDDRRYWLVTGENGEYVIRGWMYGYNAKSPEFWRTMKNQPNRPAYFIPQDRLTFHERNPLDETNPLDMQQGDFSTF